MDAPAYVETLAGLVPGAAFEAAVSRDVATVYAPADRWADTARALRDDPRLAFDVLVEVTCADYLPREPRFEVVYHFVSTSRTERLRVKLRAGEETAVATVQGIWSSANWLEREVFDMFGVVFEGHPDLRRLLMPEDWDGHPQRKDYPVQVKKAVVTYEPLQLSEEEFRANIERDRHGRPRQG